MNEIRPSPDIVGGRASGTASDRTFRLTRRPVTSRMAVDILNAKYSEFSLLELIEERVPRSAEQWLSAFRGDGIRIFKLQIATLIACI
jgi:hypothetical protein